MRASEDPNGRLVEGELMRDIRRTGVRGGRERGVRAIIAGVLIGLVLPPVALGEDKRAAARIEAMAGFLGKARSLLVAVDCAYDVVQESGQKIEFGERREV